MQGMHARATTMCLIKATKRRQNGIYVSGGIGPKARKDGIEERRSEVNISNEECRDGSGFHPRYESTRSSLPK